MLASALPLLVFAAALPDIVRTYGNLPIYFEQNRGQAARDTLYVGRAAGSVAHIRADGLTLAGGGSHVTMQVVGANRSASAQAENALEGVSNYFHGSLRLTGLRHHQRVRVRGVRPGTDLLYYGNGKQVEYDIVLHPGASASGLRLRFDAPATASPEGDLVLRTATAEFRVHKPRARPISESGKSFPATRPSSPPSPATARPTRKACPPLQAASPTSAKLSSTTTGPSSTPTLRATSTTRTPLTLTPRRFAN